MKKSTRIINLPRNYFSELTQEKKLIRKKDIIDLSEGDSGLEVEKDIIIELNTHITSENINKYPSRWGAKYLRQIILESFGLEYSTIEDIEILPVMGSKEAIAHISLSFLNKGDIVLIPDIHYPFYRIATLYSEATPYIVQTNSKSIPILNSIPKTIAMRAKILWINYPNNPTGDVISEDDIRAIIKFCKSNEILLCYDLAYKDYDYSGENHQALKYEHEYPGIIEIYSLSKSFSIAGLRLGYIVGRREYLETIERSKSVFDTGLFIGFQKLMAFIFENYDKLIKKSKYEYKHRLDFFNNEMVKMGYEVNSTSNTIYSWVKIPQIISSSEYCRLLYKKTGILSLPGIVFGKKSDDRVRFALTKPISILTEVVKRISEFKIEEI